MCWAWVGLRRRASSGKATPDIIKGINRLCYVLVCVGGECVWSSSSPLGKEPPFWRSTQLSKHSPAQHLRLLFNLIVCEMCLLCCLILEACWGFAIVCKEFSLEISREHRETLRKVFPANQMLHVTWGLCVSLYLFCSKEPLQITN